MSSLPATHRTPKLKSSVGKTLLNLPRVQRMIAAIIDGQPIKEAAKAGNMTVMRAKLCLRDPVVRRAYMKQLEDLRESQRARNIHAAIKIRDAAFDPEATAATKKVALDAARYLDGDPGGPGSTTTVYNGPVVNVVGLSIDLSGEAAPPRSIPHRSPYAAKPLIDHEDVGE